MVTWVAQKATKLCFHCDPLRKKIYWNQQNKKSPRRKIIIIEKNLDIETEKTLKLYCFT